MTPPLLRPARPQDAPALARLARETFHETFVEGFAIPYPEMDLAAFYATAYATEAALAWIGDPTGQVLVLEEPEGLVGFMQAGDNTLPAPGARAGDGELKKLYVKKSRQGRGLGVRLMDRALSFLGPRRVFIGVWSGNHPALGFYGRHGFHPVGGYGFHVGSWVDQEVILSSRDPPAAA